MKRFILFAQVCILSVTALPLPLSAQDGETAFPNYVVIGAFSHEKNAIHFTDDAKHNRYPARFEMNPNRNLYYVYVLTTDDREYARAEALRLRSETKYFDAWVYSGVFGNIGVAAINGDQQDFNPVTGQRLENVNAGENQKPTEQADINSGRTLNRAQQSMNGSTQVEQQASLQSNPSAKRNNNVAAQRQAKANPSIKPSGTQRQENGEGQGENAMDQIEGEQQTSGSYDPARKKNSVGVLQTGNTGAVIKQRTSEGVQQQSGDTSQENQQEASGAEQTYPVSQREISSETTTLATKNAAKETSAEAQQTSDRLQNDAQRTGTDSDDGSVETDLITTQQAVKIPAPVRQSTEPLSSEDVVGKNFYFHLYRADNLNTVPGEVDAIDFEKSRKMGTYPANEGVKVTMAGGKMKHISFVCQVFGYRKQQLEFDPDSPSDLLYLDDKGNLVVPFELVRLQKGDIAIMYNVFFFKDAAVMRPESRYEVNNLLDLLVENPSYNIVIHGHTNGNASGKIIRMDKAGNFYSLSGTKQGFGSAKQLSEERAVVIREFLISSGISADRMQVKAWGGKKPIHDKHSVRAQENVRVEIEILSQ